MTERYLVVDHLKFTYEGLFNSEEFYNLISGWFWEKGWDWYEKMNEEVTTPDGLQIKWLFTPWKSSSDYYKLYITLRIYLIDLKQVEVTQDNQTLKLNQGQIKITIDGHVQTDRTGRWSMSRGNKRSATKWFLAIMLDKFFFNHHYKKLALWLKSDVEQLLDQIKTYLNTYKYSPRI